MQTTWDPDLSMNINVLVAASPDAKARPVDKKELSENYSQRQDLSKYSSNERGQNSNVQVAGRT